MVPENILKPAYAAVAIATVQSSLIAIRAFDDFCRCAGKQSDDLLASDFPGLEVHYIGIGIRERTKINKRIMHLTHMDLDISDHAYSYAEALKKLIPQAIHFCNHVITLIPDCEDLHQFASDTSTVCQRVYDYYVMPNT